VPAPAVIPALVAYTQCCGYNVRSWIYLLRLPLVYLYVRGLPYVTYKLFSAKRMTGDLSLLNMGPLTGFLFGWRVELLISTETVMLP
jgi:hypothetical protein